MAKSNIINWPNQTTLTARSSTITSAFVHSITPWRTSLTPAEEKEIRDLYQQVYDTYGIEILGPDKSHNKCAYCGQPANSADHIHPLVNGSAASGSITEIYNLLPCCATCNSSKGGEDFATWYDRTETENYVRSVGGNYPVRKAALLYLIGELDKKSSSGKILAFHNTPDGKKRLADIYDKRDHINKLMRQYSEECLRFAFDAEMSTRDSKDIAKEIYPIIKKRKNGHLILNLLDKSYCKANFKLSYPVLATTRAPDAHGRFRYYATPITIGRRTYYVCQEWTERNKKPLLDWLWQNRK